MRFFLDTNGSGSGRGQDANTNDEGRSVRFPHVRSVMRSFSNGINAF
jgi:hypothetical protein